MKLRMLALAAISVGLAVSAVAANYSDLVAQGYRWITVDGPYACPAKDDVQRIANHRTDSVELEMVDDLRAYYLIPGMIVQIVQDDPPNGLTQVRLGGITTDLWTYTRFLSKRPITDPYGVIETPENSGLIPTATTGMSSMLDESGTTPVPTASPSPSVSPMVHSKSKKTTKETNQQQ
ncbi:MAG TPA: hypothetical protein VFO40_12555 [Chthoniobacterales bacterium]|nr:hypothetical protein [Chthoniobacterales bacterium]